MASREDWHKKARSKRRKRQARSTTQTYIHILFVTLFGTILWNLSGLSFLASDVEHLKKALDALHNKFDLAQVPYLPSLPSYLKYTTTIRPPLSSLQFPTTESFTSDALSHNFLIFFDTQKWDSNEHAIDPNLLLFPWDEKDTTSKLAELPYRYMHQGGWRECRQACDVRAACTAFKYEIGHQTCFLIQTSGESRRIQTWNNEIYQQWGRYTTPQLVASANKGRFKYHQHIWGLVTTPRDSSATDGNAIKLSLSDQDTLFQACVQLGGCQLPGSSSRMTSVATTVQDEYILDTFRPIGDLINSVFTKNVFGKEPYLSKRKMKSGQTPVPFSTQVIGWRMCREICRSMNTIVICIGFSSYQNECTFYKAVGQTNMKSNPVHRMTDKEADARSPVTRLYGVVRSPRAGDSLIRPYVPHLPIGPDVVVNMLQKMSEKAKKPWGQHVLRNTECKCNHTQGFVDIVELCAPNEMKKMTQAYFRNTGASKITRKEANIQDLCVYNGVGKLLHRQDSRMILKNDIHYDGKQVGKYILKKYNAMRKPTRSKKPANAAKPLWDTYFSWPIGSCPAVAPECITFINIAHHMDIKSDVVAYPYRKCCVEHIRLSLLAHVASNAFTMLNVQAVVTYGSLVGPLRTGGLLTPFDTDVDYRLNPNDLVPAIHFLELILFEDALSSIKKQTLLELGPHVKTIKEGVHVGHVAFFYGPKSKDIHMDSHLELYGQPYHSNKYGPVDDLTWPPSFICMYGKMIPTPRQPCEYLSMVYGSNPCVFPDRKQQMLNVQPYMMGAWPKQCFGDEQTWRRMRRWQHGNGESTPGSKLLNNVHRTGSSSSSFRQKSQLNVPKDNTGIKFNNVKRKYTCQPGQGPSHKSIAERENIQEMIKCKHLCDMIQNCNSLDWSKESCRIYPGKSGGRKVGSSGRTLCTAI